MTRREVLENLCYKSHEALLPIGEVKELDETYIDQAVSELDKLDLTEEDLEKVIQNLMSKYIWGYICKECRGGGMTEERNDCIKCNGTGITNWQTKGLARAILSAQRRKREER